ncbi:MAG: hypothetical protein HY897_06660 [Deltaproteobacteria bacterium]|nr:hypothetical protein [Deltaproteobacteria bacterium]
MKADPIIEEIHDIRAALSKASGDDIRKIAEAAKARQEASGRKAVRFPSRQAKLVKKAS